VPPAAIIFDNDGLLLDTELAWTHAAQRLFARYDVTFTMAHKRTLLGTSRVVAGGHLERMLGRPGGRGPALMDELHGLVMEEAARGVAPRPGAVELVDALLSVGRPIAVATNSSREFFDLVLQGSGLADRFAVTVTADEVAHGKPAPDLYLEACRRAEADPADSVGLEDSPTGAAAARAAGLFVIGVPYFADMELPGVDLRATSLADAVVHEACGLVPAAR
jgi:HAD superfamily hydrolase (TIGR01509 family)